MLSDDDKGYETDDERPNFECFKLLFQNEPRKVAKKRISRPSVLMEFRRIDSLARLLEGSSKCTAVYFHLSTQTLLITSNAISEGSRTINAPTAHIDFVFELVSKERLSIADVLENVLALKIEGSEVKIFEILKEGKFNSCNQYLDNNLDEICYNAFLKCENLNYMAMNQAIQYDGTLGGGFDALIQQYNHTFILFTKPEVGDHVKVRAASNVVSQFNKIFERIEGDRQWLMRSAIDVNGTQYLPNYRNILGNLQYLRDELARLGGVNPGLAGMQNAMQALYTNIEQAIIIQENILNRTFGSRVLRVIEFTAGAAAAVGLVAAGVGGLAIAGGTIYSVGVGIGLFSAPTAGTCACAGAGLIGVGAATAATGVGMRIISPQVAEASHDAIAAREPPILRNIYLP
jgi:hypothetical protein